jgi:ComF family protein
MPDNADREVPPSSGFLVFRALHAALDWVFPPHCAGCGTVDTTWCDACRRRLDAVPISPRRRRLPPLNAVAASGSHSGMLRAAIHALKYDHAHALAAPIGDRLAACFRLSGWTVDMIIPVPLHTTRLRERGYNQSQLIGERMALTLSLPCFPTALTRRRSTASQVGLSRDQRQQNLADAFYADPMLVAGRRLLLIDDVQTTGATLQAAAHALLNVNAVAVYGLTVTAARL